MTAKIKLNSASGGGSFSLQAPSSSSNNRVITLPDIADGTLLTSSSTTGKILQVVQTAKTSEFTSTSTSYTDLTGLSASITTQTNSKVLVIVEIQTYQDYGTHASGEGYGIQIVRTPSGGSGTNIHTSGNKYDVYGYTDSSSAIQAAFRANWHYLDSSPGGDSSTAITYKVQIGQYTSSLIRYSQDGNLSTITLMEIGA